MEIKQYTKERIPDVLQFERDLRAEEDFWGWEIDEKYIADVTASFENPTFSDSLSLLAYLDGKVVGRIDCALIHSRFDGSVKAYVDGKLEGKLGRVVGVNRNFKIKLSDYKCVIAVVNTDIHGTFYNAITHFISFEPEALPYSKVVTWFKAPEKDEEEFVSGSDGSGFSLSNLSEMDIDPTIAERGHDYYLQNYVKYLSLNGTHGRAVVVGGEAYELEFEYEDGNIKNLTCSCYCSFNCKHEFAAMLQLKDTLDYIEKNYVKEFERTHFFALIDKSKFFSFAVDGKEAGGFTI